MITPILGVTPLHTDTPQPQDTADRILAAAAQVFANKGFHGATTREIVTQAGENIASLHYYFRNKKNLYLAVFRRFIQSSWANYPLPEIIYQPVSPEIRLRAFIESALRRFFQQDRSDWSWKLALRELMDPTDALDMVIENMAQPLFNNLNRIVGELLTPDTPHQTIRMCSAGIISQFFFYRFARPVIERVIHQQSYDEEAITALADHIYHFSLNGIRACQTPTQENRS